MKVRDDEPEAVVREAVAEDRLEAVRTFERFDVGAFIRESEARRRALSPEQALALEEARRQTRLRAVRALVGTRSPEWLVEVVERNGLGVFASPEGQLLRDAMRLAAFEERGPVLDRLARHLLAHGIDRFLVLALLGPWAERWAAPCPEEEEVVEIVRRAVFAVGRRSA